MLKTKTFHGTVNIYASQYEVITPQLFEDQHHSSVQLMRYSAMQEYLPLKRKMSLPESTVFSEIAHFH